MLYVIEGQHSIPHLISGSTFGLFSTYAIITLYPEQLIAIAEIRVQYVGNRPLALIGAKRSPEIPRLSLILLFADRTPRTKHLAESTTT